MQWADVARGKYFCTMQWGSRHGLCDGHTPITAAEQEAARKDLRKKSRDAEAPSAREERKMRRHDHQVLNRTAADERARRQAGNLTAAEAARRETRLVKAAEAAVLHSKYIASLLANASNRVQPCPSASEL